MMKKIGVPTLSKRAVPGPSSLLQAKRTSCSKLLLAWSVVVLPLGWGLYVTGRSTIPMIRALLSHRH
jgi:hypothetical protein